MDGYFGFDAVAATDSTSKEKEVVAEKLWQEVVKSVQEVVKAHQELGFLEFHLKANPSMAEIEISLNGVSGALSGLLNSTNLTFSVVNDLTNCLQSIHLIRRTFIAIGRGDKKEYDDCISKLQSQRTA